MENTEIHFLKPKKCPLSYLYNTIAEVHADLNGLDELKTLMVFEFKQFLDQLLTEDHLKSVLRP